MIASPSQQHAPLDPRRRVDPPVAGFFGDAERACREQTARRMARHYRDMAEAGQPVPVSLDGHPQEQP